jgi:hypothetical protein
MLDVQKYYSPPPLLYHPYMHPFLTSQDPYL